jgi:hypothetical protein
MTKKSAFVDGDGVINTSHPAFHKALAKAKLDGFPQQKHLDSPLDKALWALWVVQDHFQHNAHDMSSLSSAEVSSILETRGIALAELQVERALARAGDRVHRKKIHGDDSRRTYYKIMVRGKDYLRDKYTGGGIRVCIADGKKPWSDRHLTFADLANELKGRICVLDKFYGVATLGILHHFKHAKAIDFLTAKTNESAAVFKKELEIFKKEYPALEVRVYPNQHELHDRYVLTQNAVLIVGHGIKDLGTKESFVLLLKGEIAADMRETLLEKFNERWNRSAPV